MKKELFKLAIPNIISNLTIPLSASIDIALMGHLSKEHLGAIALGGMIFTFLYGSFNFLRMGTTGIVAQAYGRADLAEVSLTLYRALFLAFLISFFIVVFKDFIFEIFFFVLNIADLKELVLNYFDTRVYAVFAAMANFVLMGWYFGVSNSIIPLIMSTVINLSNAFLSFLFVKYFDMQIDGVALGTLISQYLGLVVGLFYLKEYFLQKVDFYRILNKQKILRFFKINRDIFIRTIAITASLTLFYSFASSHSQTTLAVATLMMQFLTWMSYGVDGFANAAESLVGKYYGARDEKRFKEAVFLSIKYGFYLALFFSFIYFVFAKEIVFLFTDDPKVVQEFLTYRVFLFFMPLLSFLAFIFDGVFVGMTKTDVLRDSVLIGAFFYLLVFYIFKSYNYELILYLSFLLFFVIRGLYQLGWYLKYEKTNNLW